jgi:predicted ATPase
VLDKAAALWLQAGKNSAGRSANVEALRFFKRALETALALPDSQSKRELELEIQLARLPVLMAVSGYADERTREATERAFTLCNELGAYRRALPVLFAQLAHFSASAQLAQGVVVASRILKLGQVHGDNVALLVGHRTLGFYNLWQGNLSAAQDELEAALKIAAKVADSNLALEFGTDPQITALALYGHVQLSRGLADTGRGVLQKARRAAQSLGHAFTLAYVLRHQLIPEALIADYAAVQDTGGALDAICDQRDIPQWRHIGEFLCCWASIKSGDNSAEIACLLKVLSRHRRSTFQINMPFYMLLAADVALLAGDTKLADDLISEASAMIKGTNEIWVLPLLCRLRASLIATRGENNHQGREQWLLASLEKAHELQDKIAELCAAHDLARLWIDQKEQRRALGVLAPVYRGFSEGFDTAPLKQAKALLDELGGA